MALRDIFGHPAAPRRLLVCTGPCCNSDGRAEQQLEELRALILQHGLDETLIGRASCVRRSCLGRCSGNPLTLVEPDEIWYEATSSQILLQILQGHVLDGAPLVALILEEEA
jgi:(2Fe-2S) ferredoxin